MREGYEHWWSWYRWGGIIFIVLYWPVLLGLIYLLTYDPKSPEQYYRECVSQTDDRDYCAAKYIR